MPAPQFLHSYSHCHPRKPPQLKQTVGYNDECFASSVPNRTFAALLTSISYINPEYLLSLSHAVFRMQKCQLTVPSNVVRQIELKTLAFEPSPTIHARPDKSHNSTRTPNFAGRRIKKLSQVQRRLGSGFIRIKSVHCFCGGLPPDGHHRFTLSYRSVGSRAQLDPPKAKLLGSNPQPDHRLVANDMRVLAWKTGVLPRG